MDLDIERFVIFPLHNNIITESILYPKKGKYLKTTGE